jgi:hypothetical protein
MAIVDFRKVAFGNSRVDASGRFVGRNVYWKLYAIENILRVIVHSILKSQIGPAWWSTAVDSRIQRKIQDRKQDYSSSPWHSSPGGHEVYFADLLHLNEIIRANRHLFQPVISDIDLWMARIEQIRLPRNVVGHMNWPDRVDRSRIDVFYSDIQALSQKLTNNIAMSIP